MCSAPRSPVGSLEYHPRWIQDQSGAISRVTDNKVHKRRDYTYMLNSNNLSSCSLDGLVDDPEAATCTMSAGMMKTTTMLDLGVAKKLKDQETYCRAPQAPGTAMLHLLPPWWLNSKARAVGRRRNLGVQRI
jgi:hypothetical protein